MPIPRTRDELRDSVSQSFAKLKAELDSVGPKLGSQPCIDEWNVKQLLAVRSWWSTQVVAWVEDGLRDRTPIVPAEGYSWRETPQLNDAIARRANRQAYREIRSQLDAAHSKVLSLIERLSDRQLLDTSVFAWAGQWPISRWISINTARQYETARKYIRQAIRNMKQ